MNACLYQNILTLLRELPITLQFSGFLLEIFIFIILKNLMILDFLGLL